MKTRIKQLFQTGKDGDEVIVFGWVKSKRASKKFAFLVINDGSQQADLQVIIDAGTEAFNELDRANTGAAVEITGIFKESPGKGQKFEVHAQRLQVHGEADTETYPLQKKGHSLEFLREIAHLRARTNTFGAVFRVRNKLSYYIHRFFQERGFYWVHTPILTASDCEGAGEMFRVTTMNPGALAKSHPGDNFRDDFFGKPAHLTVSGQLEAESLCLGLGDVYTFGPTFRAENSNTSRHLSEFWMVEPEMAFADLNDTMELAEAFIRYLVKSLLEDSGEELHFLAKHYKESSPELLEQLLEKPFVRMSYSDAIAELGSAKRGFEFPVDWGIDLQSEHERYLTDEVCQGPVIVYDYPKDVKAFYMRQNDDGKTVAALDVLAPRIGEIIGGAQREERLPRLEARMDELDLPKEELWWYLDLRRFGSCPHAGFGMGFERLVQYLTGMTNIRDAIPFPRTPKHIDF